MAESDGSAPRWERTVQVGSAIETQRLAERLGRELRAGDLILLDGPLGAGKTTFTQGLGRGLGAVEGIISPTFVLARRHPNDAHGSRPGAPGLVHVDAYRLADASQVEDIDLEETLAEWVTVIEWGRGKVEGLSESRLEIEIERPQGGQRSLSDVLAEFAADHDEDEAAAVDEPRTLRLRGIGPRWDRVPKALHDFADQG